MILNLDDNTKLQYIADVIKQHRNKITFFLIAYVSFLQIIIYNLNQQDYLLNKLLICYPLNSREVFIISAILIGFFVAMTIIILGAVHHLYAYLKNTYLLKVIYLDKTLEASGNYVLTPKRSLMIIVCLTIIMHLVVIITFFYVAHLLLLIIFNNGNSSVLNIWLLIMYFYMVLASIQIVVIFKHIPVINLLVSRIIKKEKQDINFLDLNYGNDIKNKFVIASLFIVVFGAVVLVLENNGFKDCFLQEHFFSRQFLIIASTIMVINVVIYVLYSTSYKVLNKNGGSILNINKINYDKIKVLVGIIIIILYIVSCYFIHGAIGYFLILSVIIFLGNVFLDKKSLDMQVHNSRNIKGKKRRR